MEKLISIVLPVYNGERFLKESIESVIHQTYQNWELIIVDDGSTDKTRTISEFFCELDGRIKYFRNEMNLGLPGNLNRGFSLTKGEYLTWTSDDNKYRPNALEVMLNHLQSDPSIEFVYASYQIINENDERIREILADQKGKEHILGSNVVGACFLYTRKAYDTIGDYDRELLLVEDFDYWQRMFQKFSGAAIPELLYDYRWHDASLTSTKKEKQFGKVTETMLLKNRPGFGKLSPEADFYYKRCLYKARKQQGTLDAKTSLQYYMSKLRRRILTAQ